MANYLYIYMLHPTFIITFDTGRGDYHIINRSKLNLYATLKEKRNT